MACLRWSALVRWFTGPLVLEARSRSMVLQWCFQSSCEESVEVLSIGVSWSVESVWSVWWSEVARGQANIQTKLLYSDKDYTNRHTDTGSSDAQCQGR